MNTSRGQYFSFDAIMSALIIVIAVSMLSSYWFGAQNAPVQQEDKMQRRALAISDALLTSGNPPNWMIAQDAKVFGLAHVQNSSLSKDKIIALAGYLNDDGSYDAACGRYSVQNFFVNITSVFGSSNYPEIGRVPTDAAAQAQVVRVATLEGKIVNLKVVVWAAKQTS